MSSNKLPKLIKFKLISCDGKLIQVQEKDQVPFKIKRLFYILDIPKNKYRGCHAHKKQSQLLVCLHGNIRLAVITNKNKKKKYILKSSNYGLFIPPKIWVDKIFFDHDAILLVLCDKVFKEKDYIRNLDKFLKHIKS